MRFLLLSLCVLVSGLRVVSHRVTQLEGDAHEARAHPYATAVPWTKTFSRSGGTLGKLNEYGVVLYFIQELKFGKQPTYLVYLGGGGQLFEFSPGFQSLDGNAKNNQGDSIVRWSRTKGASMTTIVNGRSKKPYFTFFQQNKTGTAIKTGKKETVVLPNNRACSPPKKKKRKKTAPPPEIEIFQANYGDCKKAKTCGPVAFLACGSRNDHHFSFFKVLNNKADNTPVAEMSMVGSKRSKKIGMMGKKKRQFELSISPGSDPLLLSQLTIFIDLANNIQDKQEAKQQKEEKKEVKKQKAEANKEKKAANKEEQTGKDKKKGFKLLWR